MHLTRPLPLPLSIKQPNQAGFFLLEALVAILIFSLGILGLVAMGSVAINAQNDAQYRTEAANYASDIAGEILLNIDRVTVTTGSGSASITVPNPTTLATFQHFAGVPSPAGTCAFGGSASTNPVVTAWASKIISGTHPLPGATAANLQISINQTATGFNQATIIVCWQAPSDRAMRQHKLISYIN